MTTPEATGSDSEHIDPWAPPPLLPRHRLGSGNALWALGKQIDELGGEWTYNVFVPRTINFHQPAAPPLFYEPFGSFERLALEAYLVECAYEVCRPGEEGTLALAIEVFPSFFSTTDGVVVPPEPGETSIGRHTVSVIAVRGDTIYFQHAWSRWGANGMGTLSRSYFERYTRECWLFRRSDRGPLASTAERLLESDEPRHFPRLWRSPRRIEAVGNLRPGLTATWYECWSLQDESPAWVLTLRLGGVRVGISVIHYPIAELAQITDLFVWPPYRRQGYGSAMERIIRKRSRQLRCERLEAYVWDADVVKYPERPEKFLLSRGYGVERLPEGQAAMIGRSRIGGSARTGPILKRADA